MQLNIINVGSSDFGAYHCIAKNEMGMTKGIFHMYGKLLLGVFFAYLRKSNVSLIICVCLLVCPSVRLSTWNNMAPIGHLS
jgi:hypothetical protein